MKNKKISSTLNIQNDNTYFLICWDIFQKIPNTLSLYSMYDKNEFFTIIESFKEEQTTNREIIKLEDEDIINNSYFVKVNEDIYLSYSVQDSENEFTTINEIEFYYKDEINIDKVKEIIDAIEESSLTFEMDDSINNLNTLLLTSEGFDIEPIPIKVDENIDNYYNKETFKSVNSLIKGIKNSNKGLSILCGDRGSGKTTIIPYISSKIDRVVINIPNNLLDPVLNNNEFKTLLRTHTKPIIVIDDCENIFHDIYSKSNLYTNSILQLVDGLLSDVLELNVILIMNGDLEEIDNTLLEANSFIDSIEFKNLSSKEATNLSKYLNLNRKYKNKTKLIDVVKDRTQKEDKKIGIK